MAANEYANNYVYDIFLSYNKNDEREVQALSDMFDQAGIRTFFAPKALREVIGHDKWEEQIYDALTQSVHLGVYCSKDALISDWVRKEVEYFKREAASRKSEPDSLILVIMDPSLTGDEVEKILKANDLLGGIFRPRNPAQALEVVVRRRIEGLQKVVTEARQGLDQTRKLARQSFDHYRHARFWKPFAKNRSLHIFTCGRDTAEAVGQRGPGGRTNIDKWDYQAAVDITHHFARHYRDTRVEIEQPVSKALIDDQTRAFDTNEFSGRLADRDCVIIGSPDVSDFAEITLARLLSLKPYDPGAVVRTGFKIIKDGERFSTFYEPSTETEEEGVRLIDTSAVETFSSKRALKEGDRSGIAHGVMVVADNPFSKHEGANQVLILAGHTGVATGAMSLLLTNEDEWCLDEFYRLDQQIAVIKAPLAAVIEVKFERQGRDPLVGDDRLILERPGEITFKRAVSLSP